MRARRKIEAAGSSRLIPRRVALTGALALVVAALAPLALTTTASAQTGQPPLLDKSQPVEVSARPITRFQASDPGRRQFGRLEFRGGLVLSSGLAAFGGWSGISLDPDGKRFLALSDEGAWMSGEIVYKGRAPAAITVARMGPVRALKGRQLDRKRDLDAEAVRLLDGSLARGEVLVGFERNHRIGIFPVLGGELEPPTRYLKMPADARRMLSNKGFEAVAILSGGPAKGSIVAFAERYPGDAARHVGWLWGRGGEPQRFGLTDIGGFEVTDAASTPDGDLLVLERRFRWTEGVKMRLRQIPADAVRPGALLEGETIIEADMSFEIDNMEGLSVHRDPAGGLVLTLISDDNFNKLLQRTILLQFTLAEPQRAAGRRSP